MYELSVSVIATVTIRPQVYIAALVNNSDKSVRPTSHLFLIEDDTNETMTSLMVSVDALFEHLTYTADGQIYWSGHGGYVITTDPKFPSGVTEQTSEVSMYEGEQAEAAQTKWYLRRIFDEDIVLNSEIDNAVFFFSLSGDVLTYNPETGTKTFQIGARALSFCAKTENDIYVGTEWGEVWHFNGSQWERLPFVQSGLPRVWITAMAFGPDGQVFGLSRNGLIAVKTPEGDFEIIKAPPLHYNGADWIDKRLFISAREGLYEAAVADHRLDLTRLTDSFAPLSLKSGFGELIMTSATPRQTAYFVVAKPEPDQKKLISCTAMSIVYEVGT